MRIRFRSARRDESSDAKRLGSFERSIQNAISDIELEKDGLARRIKDARDSASVYVDSDASEYLDREELVQKKELSASEQVLVSAAQRVRLTKCSAGASASGVGGLEIKMTTFALEDLFSWTLLAMLAISITSYGQTKVAYYPSHVSGIACHS